MGIIENEGNTCKNVPFLALPPGLGGAMAITVRNLGVEERSEDGFLL